MLTTESDFIHIAEVNPPQLPDMSHLLLDGAWRHVMVTDNVFGKIRVSPYAYAARVTHDAPGVHPTVVVSTRDRNVLAIESEVRGALGNGVDSFLVVVGDTVPAVDHMSHHLDVVRHIQALQTHLPLFEVGMPTRFQEQHFRRNIEVGAQFLVAGPVLDPATVKEQVGRLRLRDGDPPVFLMVIPPFSPSWVAKMESFGAITVGSALRQRLHRTEDDQLRSLAWDVSLEAADAARDAGCRGVILMGLKFDTVVDEAAYRWRVADKSANRT